MRFISDENRGESILKCDRAASEDAYSSNSFETHSINLKGENMKETAFEVRVPSSLLEFGFDQRKIQRHITQWLVFSLFTEGHISSGKAAQLLNISRIEFLTLLRENNIAYIDYSAAELEEEYRAVDALQIDSPL